MSREYPQDSVGLVQPQVLHFDQPLELVCGQTLNSYTLIIETYGTLNKDGSNAVLICHALSGNHHVAGYHSDDDKKPGWWDSAVGPGKAIDTNKFFVVCLNNLGGCHGSTGPASINPETDKPYGPDFPIVTVRDWVNSQVRLADHFGIQQWAAIVGGSLGGMQALQWSIDFPERLRHCLVIASAPKLSAQNIAFNEVARQAISRDIEFHDGHYYGENTVPRTGLMLARMLGHITYLSADGMGEKFGRELRSDNISFDFTPQFEVESYLRYQGKRFSTAFDANTYLLMTKALDYYDPAAEYDNSLSSAVAQTQCKFFVASFTTDWRFSPERSREIVDALVDAGKQVSYAEIDAHHGHDAFLIPIPRYMEVFSAYMKQVEADTPAIESHDTVGGTDNAC
ncbi:MAG: homoserine O-acetyltransferase [Marinobacterium sp.]|nr:homoserine O-acetyltransferase [Marinobacterium sp.]